MSELPHTELVNERTRELDCRPTAELVALLAQEQRDAFDAIQRVSGEIALAVDEIAARLRAGGRLHYIGAGTSGRLGYLDASEMPPTFGTDPSLVCAHIAGGTGALTRAVEGAEDDEAAGIAEVRSHVDAKDAVVGLSASGGAPYVIAAIRWARKHGAWTLGVANSPDAPLLKAAHLGIALQTGAEPLTGSTRLKAGTSQKILLNTISTAVMVRLGKVYDNLMVDVVATNNKLRNRALRLVMRITGTKAAEAMQLLEAANGSVKIAAVMHKQACTISHARALLESHSGSLRSALIEPQ